MIRTTAKTILVVEDEEVLRELERSILEGWGYRVLTADSARKAFDLWKAHLGKVDLLLADIVLPRGITGVDLAKRLIEGQPQLKVIFTTGRVINGAEHESLSRLNARFLQKPFQQGDLVQVVGDTLGGTFNGTAAESVA